jgi:hypothetical protein
MCFDFLYSFCPKHFSFYEELSGDMIKKCVLVFMQCTCYSRHILMKLEFSRQVFEKYKNIKFHENPSSGSRIIPSGQAMSDEEALFAIQRMRLSRSSATKSSGTLKEIVKKRLLHKQNNTQE